MGMDSRGSVRPAAGTGNWYRRANTKTIENIPPWPHLAPVGTSPDRLVAAITAAAEDQGWRVIGEAPGVVTAILVRRSHEAVITIGYDELNFWIDYKDSKNLNYNPKDSKRRRNQRRLVTKGPSGATPIPWTVER